MLLQGVGGEEGGGEGSVAGPGLRPEVGVGVGVGGGVETLGTLVDCGQEDWQRGGLSLGFINFRLEGLEKLTELLQFGHSVFRLLNHLCLRPHSELSSAQEVHALYSRHGADPKCPFMTRPIQQIYIKFKLSV